jgi:hypothetical protein
MEGKTKEVGQGGGGNMEDCPQARSCHCRRGRDFSGLQSSRVRGPVAALSARGGVRAVEAGQGGGGAGKEGGNSTEEAEKRAGQKEPL